MPKVMMTWSAALGLALVIGAGLQAEAASISASPLLSRQVDDVRPDGLHNAQFGRRYCRLWRRRCAARWGWFVPRFHRCMWRHGC